MEITRRLTDTVQAGPVSMGGRHPIVVQSMTNTRTEDAAATLAQIRRLAECGCEIARVAVPHLEAANSLAAIVKGSPIPVVADIHFDHRLALAALEAGVHKLRINPGNIGSAARVAEVVNAARQRGVPIRIGVNAGSLGRELLRKYGHPTPEALVESALSHVRILQDLDFHAIVISLKASDIPLTVAAYRQLAEQVPYPLHLGITEAGTAYAGTVTSAIGIGALLLDGIGATIRVSLTAPPEEEVRAGFAILKALGLRRRGPRFISCPSCGRTAVDLIGLANDIETALGGLPDPVVIAVMGCEVNGPGEAAEADIGLACGQKASLLFQKGKVVKKLANANLAEAFVAEVHAFLAARRLEESRP